MSQKHIGKIFKVLIINIDFCVPRRHRLLGKTIKQPLRNFEPKKP